MPPARRRCRPSRHAVAIGGGSERGRVRAPLWLCAVMLVGWLAVCFGIAEFKFRWQ